MAWDTEDPSDEKVGYNQAGEISRTLSVLRNTYVSSMIDANFSSSLKVCRRVLDIISARLEEKEIEGVDAMIKKIKESLVKAEETYVSQGGKYFKDPTTRDEVEILLENLWRKLEQIQDDKGYGMFSQDESGL